MLYTHPLAHIGREDVNCEMIIENLEPFFSHEILT